MHVPGHPFPGALTVGERGGEGELGDTFHDRPEQTTEIRFVADNPRGKFALICLCWSIARAGMRRVSRCGVMAVLMECFSFSG